MEAAEVWFREYLDCDWYQMNAYEELGTPVVHMELDFVSPLIGNDLLEITLTLEQVSRSTLTLAFDGYKIGNNADEKVQSFTAKIIFCFFSNKTSKAKPIPKEQLALLDEYLLGCEQ